MMTKHDTRTLHNLCKGKLATITVDTGSTTTEVISRLSDYAR